MQQHGKVGAEGNKDQTSYFNTRLMLKINFKQYNMQHNTTKLKL